MLCFALIAHENEEALRNQFRNIRKYNSKDCPIVLFNGGSDPNFGKKVCKEEHVHYCPYSRPLGQRQGGYFLYDVMRWLEKKKVDYEYLVYLESDVFFVNNGFEKLLKNAMKGYDCMVKMMKKESDPKKAEWPPAVEMWQNWKHWKPVFERDHFYRTSSPMSVFRHGIVKRMLKGVDNNLMKRLLRDSHIRCLGEMLYITLAIKHGAKVGLYPEANKRYLRFRPALTLKEIKIAKSRPEIMFVHPVKDEEVRNWIFKH
jgi:hypothetical protein